MPRRAFAYRITTADVGLAGDVDFFRAPKAVRAEVLRWVLILGLKEKRLDISRGLDAKGNPLAPISEATKRRRESAMGPADPSAPPLTPAYQVSRTSLLLTGAVGRSLDYVEYFWEYDPHTGGSWGKILDYHRKGIGRSKVKRDEIGISAAAVARVRQEVLERWRAYLRTGVLTGSRAASAPAIPPKTLVAVGKTDYQNFTFGIGGDGAPRAGQSATGFRQRSPGQGLPGFGGPGPRGPGRGFRPEGPIEDSPYWRPRKPPGGPRTGGTAPKPKRPAPSPATPPAAPPAPPRPSGPILPGRPIGERIAGYAEGHRKAEAVEAVVRAHAAELAALKEEIHALRNEHARLMREWEAGQGLRKTPERRAAWMEARTKAGDAERRLSELRARRDSHGERLRAAVAEVLKVDDPLMIQTPHGGETSTGRKLKPIPDDRRKDFEAARDWLASITRKMDAPGIVVDTGIIPKPEAQRSYYRVGHETMALSDDFRPGVVVHELGHAIETQVFTGKSRVLDRSLEFLNHRVGDEPLVKLRDVIPGSNYGPEERGRKDRFEESVGLKSAYYVGKDYSTWGSEILSMGAEALYDRPGDLAKDREWLVYVIGVLDGALR